jgi:dolichyl-diphosphooligosaccharide--protein glycosyltransferase
MLRAERIAATFAVFLAALAARLVWWPRVFSDRGPVPPHGADEYYHLRRILHAVENFPSVLERDSYVNFPQGGEIVWPPAFDFFVAALAQLGAAADSAAVVAFAMCVPPVLGALAAVAVLWIAARAFGWTAGWIAGVLLALLPGAFRTTQLGMVDHHAAAALFSALLFGGAMAVARRAPTAPWWRLALALSLGAAAFQLTWMGALLPLALLQGLAALWILHAPQSLVAVSRAQHVGGALALLALLLVPFAWGREWAQFEASSPLVLSRFHPLWFGATALVCLLLAQLWQRTRLGDRALTRWASGAACGLALLAAGLAAAGDALAALDTAAGWFRQDESFQHFVAELRPFYRDLNGSRVAGPERQLTRLVHFTPLALGWLAWRAWRERRSDWWVLVAWTSAAALATLEQQRFLNSLCAPYAIGLPASSSCRPAHGYGVRATPLLRPACTRACWPTGRSRSGCARTRLRPSATSTRRSNPSTACWATGVLGTCCASLRSVRSFRTTSASTAVARASRRPSATTPRPARARPRPRSRHCPCATWSSIATARGMPTAMRRPR